MTIIGSISGRNGFDLKDCLEDKIRKNNKKYPVESAKGSNLKYTERVGDTDERDKLQLL